jgi:hypothetical protein
VQDIYGSESYGSHDFFPVFNAKHSVLNVYRFFAASSATEGPILTTGNYGFIDRLQ